MKKGKSTDIRILEPAVYWERKLNINYETEFVRYKKLCTRKIRKREIRKLDGLYYLTYSDWEQKMIATLSSLSESETYEYIHFLYGRAKNSNFIVYLTSGFLFPIMTSFICALIFEFSDVLTSINSFLSFLIIVIWLIWIVYKLRKIIFEYRDDSLHGSFYTDLAHIVENHYKKLTEN